MILPDSRAHFRASLRNQKRPCPIQDTVFFYQVSDQSADIADQGSRTSGLAAVPADLEAGLGSGLGCGGGAGVDIAILGGQMWTHIPHIFNAFSMQLIS